MEPEGVSSPPADTTTTVADRDSPPVQDSDAPAAEAEAPPAPPGSPPRRRDAPLEAPAPIPLLGGRQLRLPKLRAPKLRAPKLRKPKQAKPSRRDRKAAARSVQLRRTNRIIRRVDPWSVLKISAIFYICIWVMALTSAVLLWAAAASTGAIESIEDVIKELFGLETFAFEPAEMLRACFVGGFVLVIAGSLVNVLLTVVFNLISDIVGGVRLTFLEEEPTRRQPR
jgi:hypothetical protein